MTGISQNAKNGNLPEFGEAIATASKALCGFTEAAAQVFPCDDPWTAPCPPSLPPQQPDTDVDNQEVMFAKPTLRKLHLPSVEMFVSNHGIPTVLVAPLPPPHRAPATLGYGDTVHSWAMLISICKSFFT